jgi:hypothetical protein
VAKGVWPFKGGPGTGPGPRPCLRPATIGFDLPREKGRRIVRAEPFVNGSARPVRTGDDIRGVTLHGLPQSGTLTVRIVGHDNTRDSRTTTWTWRGCGGGNPHTADVD